MRFPILSSPDQGRRMHENKGCSGVSIQYREASTIGRRQESPCHSAQLSLSVEFRVPIDCSMRSDWYFLHSLLTSAEPRPSAAAFSRTTVRREGQGRGISRSVARAGQAVFRSRSFRPRASCTASQFSGTSHKVLQLQSNGVPTAVTVS